MRECKGLVDSLVYFIQQSLDNNAASKFMTRCPADHPTRVLGSEVVWHFSQGPLFPLRHPPKVCPLQSVENSACVLRNLSYRLYEEMPSFYQNRLEGPGRNNRSVKKGDVVGCFTPQSRKVKE
eukprot:g33081.t1